MNAIKVLPKRVYELIAAGEVVERPASVVKELVENSIDAGASQITVEIKNGGIAYIRVTDNGIGIRAGEVRTAFLSHATSKIGEDADLYSIETLGFRGEALASIAAVSKVEMMTRTRDENSGVLFKMQSGEETAFQEAGCPAGSTLIVRDLFYNTPARMKFLKKDVYEGNAVASVMEKLALSRSDIAFKFIRDGKIALQTPGDGKTESAVYAVFGSSIFSNMMKASYRIGDIAVSGFVSAPSGARMNKNLQLFFLNGRFIKNQTAATALSEAYKGFLVPGKYPACVLYIEMPPGKVDVNVHPAKTEVRFENEKELFHAVYYAAKTANEAYAQSFTAAAPSQESDAKRASDTGDSILLPPDRENKEQKAADATSGLGDGYKAAETLTAAAYRLTPAEREPVQVTFPESGFMTDGYAGNDLSVPKGLRRMPDGSAAEGSGKPEEFIVIGEVFETYFIVQTADAVFFIDKHAAHERMIYDSIKSSSGHAPSQLLLVPVCVNLTQEEYTAAVENLALLENAGFLVEDFGPGTVIVRQAPMHTDLADIADMVVETSGYLAENKNDTVPKKLDWLYHSVACRAAVKAGSFTSEQEREQFVREVFASPSVRNCPHGRPVMFRMDRRELEKRFDRA
ncbi:MAG TPA: DNA mismatch repair endonuclease MutL [Clostridiales bacterium]|nr:DNA mismatch repair endonuclease MutL [Clostridiales bacterium]HQH62951.1 DNA mismatch repair endonuclease MutL [Clostridiales bacterium]HQK73099.1 DNA mismatch repair endonuclease MutL [Clostridiales bacterium]